MNKIHSMIASFVLTILLCGQCATAMAGEQNYNQTISLSQIDECWLAYHQSKDIRYANKVLNTYFVFANDSLIDPEDIETVAQGLGRKQHTPEQVNQMSALLVKYNKRNRLQQLMTAATAAWTVSAYIETDDQVAKTVQQMIAHTNNQPAANTLVHYISSNQATFAGKGRVMFNVTKSDAVKAKDLHNFFAHTSKEAFLKIKSAAATSHKIGNPLNVNIVYDLSLGSNFTATIDIMRPDGTIVKLPRLSQTTPQTAKSNHQILASQVPLKVKDIDQKGLYIVSVTTSFDGKFYDHNNYVYYVN